MSHLGREGPGSLPQASGIGVGKGVGVGLEEGFSLEDTAFRTKGLQT